MGSLLAWEAGPGGYLCCFSAPAAPWDPAASLLLDIPVGTARPPRVFLPVFVLQWAKSAHEFSSSMSLWAEKRELTFQDLQDSGRRCFQPTNNRKVTCSDLQQWDICVAVQAACLVELGYFSFCISTCEGVSCADLLQGPVVAEIVTEGIVWG